MIKKKYYFLTKVTHSSVTLQIKNNAELKIEQNMKSTKTGAMKL